MECQHPQQEQQQQQQQQQLQQSTDQSISNSLTAVTQQVTKSETQGDESNVTPSLTNNLNRGKNYLQAQRRVRRSRKLIKSNLHLTLSDPEDTDSEENLRSLDYSSNFMSINFPNTPWDNNNLPLNDVLNEQIDSDTEGKKKNRLINRPVTVPANFNNRYNLFYDSLPTTVIHN